MHQLVFIHGKDGTLCCSGLIVLCLANCADEVEAGVAIRCWIAIIEVVSPRLEQVLINLVVFLGSSWVFGEAVEKMVTEVQSPVLEQASALVVSFEHCYFEGVEALPIHRLG